MIEETRVKPPVDLGGGFGISGLCQVTVERRTPGFPEYGTVEHIREKNLIITPGMNFLASMISSQAIGANSQMAYMAVGTNATAATVLQSMTLGEVVRKAFSVVSVGANSWSAVTTFGGGSDSIVGVTVAEALVVNAAASGTGIALNRAILGATFSLQNSDVAAVQFIIACGSR